MILATTTEMVPLREDAKGVIHVGGTRVTLDTVIAAFAEGATAEEIGQQYPSLGLADIYYVIGYYLRHPAEIESYLQQRKVQVDRVREENESRFDPQGIRDRLVARHNKGQ